MTATTPHSPPQMRRGSAKRGVVTAILLVLAILLLTPTVAQAYVGPGAGFAFLSSFLTLFLAFLYSLFAFVTWPVRRLFRLIRGWKAYRRGRVKRVVIVGFDGLDPDLATRFMQEG